MKREENNGSNGGSGGSASGQGQQNNTPNNTPSYANLWDTPKPAAAAAPVQQQSQQMPTDPNKAFADHVASLGLTNGINFQTVANDIRNGDHSSLEAAFNTLGANSYRSGVADAQRLMDSKVKDAVGQAVDQSTGNYKSDMVIGQMKMALPFTAAPEIEPIAKAVLTQFIKQGKSQTQAIEEVGKFFEHVSKTAGGNVQSAPDGQPGSRNYNNGKQSQETDWDSIFTSLAQ